MNVNDPAASPTAAPIGPLTWELDVAVATHPLMLANFARVFAIAAALMAALLAFLLAVNGDTAAILPIVGMTTALAGGLFLFTIVVALVFFRNRMHMRFSLDAAGASAAVDDRRARAANAAAIVVGTLAGKPGVAGAGLIGASTSRQSVVWGAIARARFHPRLHVVTLANGWRTVLVLFCRADNYEAVASVVRAALAAHPPSHRATRNPLPRLLLRSALTVIATLPLFRLPDNLEVGSFMPLLVLCFALATVWLVPLLAWVVIGVLVCIAGLALLNGLALSASLFGEGLSPVYRVLSGDDWAVLALAALGAGYLLWLSIAALRGRIRSGLAGDWEDLAGGEEHS